MKQPNLEQSGIDWDRVRDRLQATGSALAEAQTPSPQRVEDAYRRRAIRLAKSRVERTTVSAGLPVLIFRLAQERYAIEMKELTEVVRFARCTLVPGAPPQFVGVISVRGELRAIADLGRLLAPSATGSADAGFVLMMRGKAPGMGGQEIGWKVDSIEELREIRRDELTLPAQARYGKGLVSGTLMLLDVEKLMAEIISR